MVFIETLNQYTTQNNFLMECLPYLKHVKCTGFDVIDVSQMTTICLARHDWINQGAFYLDTQLEDVFFDVE